jgi:hypothetical protein
MFIKYSVVKVYMEKRLSISISEIRAVQMIRDSYVIYLPKDWCEKNFIRKGSRVYIRGLGKRHKKRSLQDNVWLGRGR